MKANIIFFILFIFLLTNCVTNESDNLSIEDENLSDNITRNLIPQPISPYTDVFKIVYDSSITPIRIEEIRNSYFTRCKNPHDPFPTPYIPYAIELLDEYPINLYIEYWQLMPCPDGDHPKPGHATGEIIDEADVTAINCVFGGC